MLRDITITPGRWNANKNAGPRYFSRAGGHTDMNPSKVARGGFGKHNWGQPGDELDDQEEFDDQVFFSKSRRRSSNHAMNEQMLKELNEKCDKLVTEA
ncbi:hypothetical protein CA3LBN_000595 [Candidozyma haemuli]|uniref:Hyaluronan/mRNA-binding protein domain-containing protein n=1 Tax=Candidozyma haemuli TaxID=45357 RepID=A0ABX8I0H7_9ASCO|nr:hypothetical protein CA3LBN_000595 [[Candida] haemuloni]